MTKLIIVRGLPGSGKSTFAKTLFANHLEADMYFMTDGEYEFNPNKLHDAHIWCQNTTDHIISNGCDVVVSNTFTTMKEMKPYIEIAHKHNAEIVVYRCVKDYGSIHDVPETTIERMKHRFCDYPNEIIVGGSE